MTSSSKNKGNCFERELVNQAKDSGLESKRAYASDGRSLGHHEEVDLLVASKRIQAKRRKSIAKYLLPNENVDAVAFRPDRGETVVLITWWEYLDLVKASQGEQSPPMPEIERLRELIQDLHTCGDISPDLWDRIKKEVSE